MMKVPGGEGAAVKAGLVKFDFCDVMSLSVLTQRKYKI